MPLKGQARRDYDLAYRNKRREAWIDSQGRICALCQSVDGPWEIDHIDPATKEHRVVSLWSRTRAVRDYELAKCQLLCESCHHIKSGQESMKPITHGMSGYKRGCRCDICHQALLTYWKNRRSAPLS